MHKYRAVFGGKRPAEKMGGGRTVLCVKRVKQEMPDEWDEAMPLPGDIIEGFAYDENEDAGEESFVPARARSEFNSLLGKAVGKRNSEEMIWVKVRRGENVVKIRARVVAEKGGMLHQRYTIRAAADDRHVAVLGDLSLEQCSELQEMSRKVVSVDGERFDRRGMKYDWKMKVGTYLPDPRSPVISSIFFMPLAEEHSVDAITARSMAWFSAAVSSGAPLVFVNIQTEQIQDPDINYQTGKEISSARQKALPMNFHVLHGVRLWFLPGIAEVSLDVVPGPEKTRFGMNIKRTDEGFIFIYSVALGSSADHAGLRHLHEEANAKGHLLVISRLEGRSLMPSSVCSSGLINCCDLSNIRDIMTEAIEKMDGIRVHIMAWPNQTRSVGARGTVLATLRPPTGCASPPI